MKKIISFMTLLVLSLGLVSSVSAAETTTEQEIISDYVFAKGGLVGLKAEVISSGTGGTEYLLMMGLRKGAEDNGINLMELALEIPTNTFEIVGGAEEGVLVGGYWGSAVAEIDYNESTGFLTADVGVDRGTVAGEPVEELLGVRLKVKGTNPNATATIKLQGEEEGQTANLKLMSAATPGTNYFTGSVSLVMEGLPTVTPITPVVEEPKKEIPTTVTPVSTGTGTTVEAKEVETGANEVALFVILGLLSAASYVTYRRKQKA